MSHEIKTSKTTCIEGESLQEWLRAYLKDYIDGVSESNILLLPNEPLDYTSESGYFLEVDVNNQITRPQLIDKRVPTDNTEQAYFHVADVVEAAYTGGFLRERYYHVLHRNSH